MCNFLVSELGGPLINSLLECHTRKFSGDKPQLYIHQSSHQSMFRIFWLFILQIANVSISKRLDLQLWNQFLLLDCQVSFSPAMNSCLDLLSKLHFLTNWSDHHLKFHQGFHLFQKSTLLTENQWQFALDENLCIGTIVNTISNWE